ncbi:hypothetical protein CBR_g488 [Chara braunii]|uniref:RING-type domain-containing protein n=1 Tax=Chara braunii TaxID=69332 RepID=A0A388KBE7_CHABU|nr:hypothetical protein CBR_g488 [Chara braunii]|eukprot:GBG67351.1 hypothetical protein CBR_g488 [Chara braunii]
MTAVSSEEVGIKEEGHLSQVEKEECVTATAFASREMEAKEKQPQQQAEEGSRSAVGVSSKEREDPYSDKDPYTVGDPNTDGDPNKFENEDKKGGEQLEATQAEEVTIDGQSDGGEKGKQGESSTPVEGLKETAAVEAPNPDPAAGNESDDGAPTPSDPYTSEVSVDEEQLPSTECSVKLASSDHPTSDSNVVAAGGDAKAEVTASDAGIATASAPKETSATAEEVPASASAPSASGTKAPLSSSSASVPASAASDPGTESNVDVAAGPGEAEAEVATESAPKAASLAAADLPVSVSSSSPSTDGDASSAPLAAVAQTLVSPGAAGAAAEAQVSGATEAASLSGAAAGEDAKETGVAASCPSQEKDVTVSALPISAFSKLSAECSSSAAADAYQAEPFQFVKATDSERSGQNDDSEDCAVLAPVTEDDGSGGDLSSSSVKEDDGSGGDLSSSSVPLDAEVVKVVVETPALSAVRAFGSCVPARTANDEEEGCDDSGKQKKNVSGGGGARVLAHPPRGEEVFYRYHNAAPPAPFVGSAPVVLHGGVVKGERITRFPGDLELADTDIPADLRCSLCSFTFKMAIIVAPCGHSFCRECFARYSSMVGVEDLVCPYVEEDGCQCDEKLFKDVAVDIKTRVAVDEIPMRCPNGLSFNVLEEMFEKISSWEGEGLEDWQKTLKRDACPEVVPYLRLNDHVRECAYHLVRCRNRADGCNDIILRRDVDTHEMSCEYRFEQCELCDDRIRWVDRDKHATDQCPFREVSCRNSDFGCTFKGVIKELDTHLLLSCHYERCRADFEKMQSTIANLQRQKEIADEKIAKLELDLKAKESKIADVEGAIKKRDATARSGVDPSASSAEVGKSGSFKQWFRRGSGRSRSTPQRRLTFSCGPIPAGGAHS